MWTAHASIIGNAGDAAVALGAAAAALPGVIAAQPARRRHGGPASATGRFARRAVRRAAAAAGRARRGRRSRRAGRRRDPVRVRRELLHRAARRSRSAPARPLGGAAAATPAAGLRRQPGRPPSACSSSAWSSTCCSRGSTTLLGAGDTLASQANASQTFAYVQSERRRASRPGWSPSGSCAATAPAPGRGTCSPARCPACCCCSPRCSPVLGGASLLGIVRDFSEGDRALVEFTDFARLRNALVVLFVGGIASMIAVGRTMRAAD